MEKIQRDLLTLIKKEPDKEHSVLIVFKQGTDIERLNLYNYKVIMDEILSTTLSGNQIFALSKLDVVISIEKDEELEII